MVASPGARRIAREQVGVGGRDAAVRSRCVGGGPASLPAPAGPATDATGFPRQDGAGKGGLACVPGSHRARRIDRLSPGCQTRGVDSILLEGIVVPAALGVSKAERQMRRPVDIDLELVTDLRRAGESDRLAHTLDYGRVYHDVERIAGEREYRLVEALAEQIAQELLKSCPIESCTVTVRKRSPVAGDLRHAGVRITRSRG